MCAGGICTINAFSKTEILPCWCSIYFFCLIITQTKAPSLGRVKCLVFSRIKPNPVMDWLLNDAGVAWGSVYVSFCIQKQLAKESRSQNFVWKTKKEKKMLLIGIHEGSCSVSQCMAGRGSCTSPLRITLGRILSLFMTQIPGSTEDGRQSIWAGMK